MTSEICANCGHSNEYHIGWRDNFEGANPEENPIGICDYPKCQCKKFIPQKKEWNDFYAPKSRYIPQNNNPQKRTVGERAFDKSSNREQTCSGFESHTVLNNHGSDDASSLSDKIEELEKRWKEQLKLNEALMEGLRLLTKSLEVI